MDYRHDNGRDDMPGRRENNYHHRTYEATHYEFNNVTFHDGQAFGRTTPNMRRKVRQKHDEISEWLFPQLDKITFLGLLPRTQYIPESPPINRNDSRLSWAFTNIDFKFWESANGPQVLWLSAPPNRGMTKVSSYIAQQAISQEKDSVFHFSSFCAEMGARRSLVSTFTFTILYYILSGSEEFQATPMITVFLKTLLYALLEQGGMVHKQDPLAMTVDELFHTSDSELLKALEKVVFHIKAVRQSSIIIIDEVDRIGDEAVFFFNKFCRHVVEAGALGLKLFFTCSVEYGKKIHSMPFIEYDKERKECLNSLYFRNDRYTNISKEHTGSFEWLWTHTQYKRWSASKGSSLLYIEGKPGSGKSTLTKYFSKNFTRIDQNATARVIVHYFYTDRSTQQERSHKAMLQSILWGILNQDETAFCLFQARFRENHQSQDGIWTYECLKDVLSSFCDHITTQICLILDAVDESEVDDRRKITDLLCRLCSNDNPCSIKIFLASRPVPELRHRIQHYHHVIRLQEENEQDILKVGQHFLRQFGLSGDLLFQATEYIRRHSQGVFVWVDLVNKELRHYMETGGTKGGILQVLEDMPCEDLNDIYFRILNRIASHATQTIQDAAKTFQFVLFAYRPLTVTELYHALAIPPNTNPRFLPSDEMFQRNPLEMEKKISYYGDNLLEMKDLQPEVRIVQVMHQTVREFLLHTKQKEIGSFMMSGPEGFQVAHITITKTCIRYLWFCFLNPAIQKAYPAILYWDSGHFGYYVRYLNEWPFINYVFENFKQHLECCARDKYTLWLVSTLIEKLKENPPSRFLGNWIASHLEQPNHALADLEASDFKYLALNVAAEKNLPQVAKALLTICGSQGEALLISAGKGYESAVQFLLSLKGGRDLEYQDSLGQRPLHHAVKNEQQKIAELLLLNGADRKACDNEGQSPLDLALLKL